MKYSILLIGAAIVAGTYAVMCMVAKSRTEDVHIDDDNPYLNQTVNPSTTSSDNIAGLANFQSNSMWEEKICGAVECDGVAKGHYPFYINIVKPALDRILSFCGLIILSPLYCAISLAIYLDDPGSVFFTQKRIGKDKTYFMCHKFRSMKMSTPHDVPTHQLTNPEQYITKVGKILRKTSLDELPQIWDIFRGRMSVIGPRPALWNQYDLVAERDKWNANSVLPGLTGLAQINGRDELEIQEKARLDGQYVAHIDFRMDTKCFFGTIRSVIRHDGVIEGGTGEMKRQEQNK